MSDKNQDKTFFRTEGDNYFERNGPRVNKGIIRAIKFLKPKSNSDILEIGCGCGSTLKKIKYIYKSNVFGIDASRKAINYALKKNKLKKMYHSTFMSFNIKKKFDIVITGGFLYVTPEKSLKSTLKKIFNLIKKNSYLIIWDYDTPKSYSNIWKYDKNLKSFKRNLLKSIYEIDKDMYLVSKQLQLKDGSKIKVYDHKVNLDNIFTVMILKKTK